MDIAGKTVLITGGAVRIGSEFCRAFASAGARVIIHCNASCVAAETLRMQLPFPENHKVVKCDFNSSAETELLFSRTGKVDILINNASIYRPSPLLEESAADIEQHFKINCLAPVLLMKQFAAQPGLKSGCVINILDQEIAGTVPASGGYALSKRALADATLKAALESAPRLRINAIAPGPVLAPPGKEHLGMEKTLKSVPLGRQVALCDLAAASIFLACNESITGQILFVDCGQHLTS
ncbi:MAG: SDR family oxidoreductase [Victivallaceae bacterium]